MEKTLDSFLKNWMIIFTGIAYGVINSVIYMIVGSVFRGFLSIFAGIVLAIVSSAMISNYLYLLFNIINYNKISLQDFKDGFGYFLRKIYTIFFFAWIASYALSLVQGILQLNLIVINLIAMVFVLILLNPLPEALYQKSLDSMGSIIYSIDFMKENWLNWLIPNVIFYIILYMVTGNVILGLFTRNISFGLNNMIFYLLGQAMFAFTMIYRGHLFKLLSTSTRRKRMFMNKF